MSKSIQIIAIFCIIFMLFMSVFVQATDVNMNLTADDISTATNDLTNTATTQNTVNDGQSTNTLTPDETNYSNDSATISTLNELPEANLGLGNVLNIILIVIGVLLILLGIAIIIRLNS